jgi:hypothetical protein
MSLAHADRRHSYCAFLLRYEIVGDSCYERREPAINDRPEREQQECVATIRFPCQR